MKKIIILIILIVLILFFAFKGCTKSKEEQLVFNDLQFEKMIKKELKKDAIYQSDLSEISGLMIAADRLLGFSGGGHTDKSVILLGSDTFEYQEKRYPGFGTIKSLADLKYFPKLTSLRIYLQPNIDFNTIPNRGNIYNLGLSQNKITDLSFLKGFDKLLYLTLSTNKITDLAGIENVKNIKRLGLNSNEVNDLSLLVNFNNLEYLDLTYNKVTNITPISNLPKLNYLSLYENGISDISPLANLKTLKSLYLNNNNITDISALKDFISFEALNVTGNPITNYEVIDHIKNADK